jgi:hypothetical protein
LHLPLPWLLSDLAFFAASFASQKARQFLRGAGSITAKTWDDAGLAFSRKDKGAEKGEIG